MVGDRVTLRFARVLSPMILAVLLTTLSGCGSRSPETTSSVLTGSSPLPALAIRSNESSGSLCYSVTERSTDAVVDQSCPLLDLQEYEFNFGQRSQYGGGAYVVIWLRADVAVMSSMSKFERSAEGWTLFEVGDSAYAEFTVRIGESMYNCAVGTDVSCLPQ